MSASAIGTIRTLLESVLDGVDDADQQFRLRTALQLLDAVEQHEEHARIALENADLDAELTELLTELGYLD